MHARELSDSAPSRVVVVWCPDWPVMAAATAAGASLFDPIATVSSGLVVACSVAARAEGVRRGMRLRDAMARCGGLVVHHEDPVRAGGLFEPVVAAVAELLAAVEVVRPGVIVAPASGPARYVGGEDQLAERLIDQLDAHTGVSAQIGVADGFFAAMVAARRGVIVPPGQSAEFLAPLDIRELHHLDAGAGEHAELLDVLWRLGLRTLGAFTTVPERDIASRFGAEGARVHRAARGEERRALSRRRPAPELTVSQTLDPPVDRVDTAGFVARRIAGRLQALLVSHGVSCLRMGIHARTANDENLVRVWRCVQPVSTVAVADQVRWQLEGWLCGGGGMPPPTAGVVELRLEPIDVVEAGRLQLDLVTATDADGRDRAGRALVHVQGLLGFDAVCTPVIDGGRGPVERARLVVWGEQRHRRRAPGAPWPGRLPPLSPVVIPSPSPQGRVVDMTGASVVVSRRCEINAAPHLVQVEGWPPMPVLAWSRPWPVDERWWATDGAVRCARLQVVVDRGPTTGCGTAECPDQLALLVACTGGRWRVEGIYG